MAEYFAFLRGINVSGQKLIKMTDLTKIFIDAGFSDVKTFIQSGNVGFSSGVTNIEILEKKIEQALTNSLGYHVEIFLYTSTEIRKEVEMEPFRAYDENTLVKKYVTFTKQGLPLTVKLPYFSPSHDVELIATARSLIFSIAYPTGDGRSGFPNLFIEKEFKIQATTRNWNTVCKMVDG
jgi:uncharacterized protein (DUF1697 family)